MHERIWPMVLPNLPTKRLLGIEDESGFQEAYPDLVTVTRSCQLGDALFGGIFRREGRKTVNEKILRKAKELIEQTGPMTEEAIGQLETELLQETQELFDDHGKGKMTFKVWYRGFLITLETGSLQQRVHLTIMAAVKGMAAEVGALEPFGPEAQLFTDGDTARKKDYTINVLKRTQVAREWAKAATKNKKFASASEMQARTAKVKKI
eukprot:5793128-Amphidinium_carterae.2